MPHQQAVVGNKVPLEIAKRRHPASIGDGDEASGGYPTCAMELHVVFEQDEQGWVRATIEELPGVITCAPTHAEARALIRDALGEWLQALTSEERATIGAEATRETLTLSVA